MVGLSASLVFGLRAGQGTPPREPRRIDRPPCEGLTEAKDEARRAITALLDGRDPKRLVPSDDPTLADLLAEYDREKPRKDRWQIGRIVKAQVCGRRFGSYRVSTITADILKQFGRTRPLVAANRDLALLRAVCNWAVLGGLLHHGPHFASGTCLRPVWRARRRGRDRVAGGRTGTAPGGCWRAGRSDYGGTRDRLSQRRIALAPVASGAILAAGGTVPAGGEDQSQARSADPDLVGAATGAHAAT